MLRTESIDVFLSTSCTKLLPIFQDFRLQWRKYFHITMCCTDALYVLTFLIPITVFLVSKNRVGHLHKFVSNFKRRKLFTIFCSHNYNFLLFLLWFKTLMENNSSVDTSVLSFNWTLAEELRCNHTLHFKSMGPEKRNVQSGTKRIKNYAITGLSKHYLNKIINQKG